MSKVKVTDIDITTDEVCTALLWLQNRSTTDQY
jgi:hypothetical protein